MANKIKETFYKLALFGASLVAGSTLTTKNVQAQSIPPVSGVLNPFTTYDNTNVARETNAQKTKQSRDLLLKTRTEASIIPTIPSSIEAFLNCNDYAVWFYSASSDTVKKNTKYAGSFLFDNYDGTNPTTIIEKKGTFATQGTIGFKMLIYGMNDYQTMPGGHSGNMSVTGNHALEFSSQNYIEPHYALTNLQPGKIEEKIGAPVIPFNCDTFEIGWPYTFINNEGYEQLWTQKILGYKIVDGEAILIYNINDDPKYNKNAHLITERDTVPPEIVKFEVNGNTLSWEVKDDNPRNINYSYDGGKTRIPLPDFKGTTDMGINKSGMYTINLYADDYFLLSSTAQEITSIPTGINDNQESKYIAYPNPVKDNLILKYPENTYSTITLRNIAGQTLEQKIDNDQDGYTTIDMSNYASGPYTYTISTTSNYVNKNPTVETGKIIKE
jgi:hypothetical protein